MFHQGVFHLALRYYLIHLLKKVIIERRNDFINDGKDFAFVDKKVRIDEESNDRHFEGKGVVVAQNLH